MRCKYLLYLLTSSYHFFFFFHLYFILQKVEVIAVSLFAERRRIEEENKTKLCSNFIFVFYVLRVSETIERERESNCLSFYELLQIKKFAKRTLKKRIAGKIPHASLSRFIQPYLVFSYTGIHTHIMNVRCTYVRRNRHLHIVFRRCGLYFASELHGTSYYMIGTRRPSDLCVLLCRRSRESSNLGVVRATDKQVKLPWFSTFEFYITELITDSKVASSRCLREFRKSLNSKYGDFNFCARLVSYMAWLWFNFAVLLCKI